MYKRFNELNFVIGLFFSIIAVILLIGSFMDESLSSQLNRYTGVVFLLFGLLMMFVRKKKTV